MFMCVVREKGCRHEKAACSTTTGYAFGYSYLTKFRTVMSYSCTNGVACPRVLFFSSSTAQYNGVMVGNAEADNARMIQSRATEVAALRNVPTGSDLTCPVTNECSQKNQMYKRYLFGLLCFTKCVSESTIARHQFFGWKCGKC
jgi:hypothetical protein